MIANNVLSFAPGRRTTQRRDDRKTVRLVTGEAGAIDPFGDPNRAEKGEDEHREPVAVSDNR